jgi:four helix bundle protein
MYRLSHRLPDFEKYALGNQIRRAAVSLTNNIAEGHGRHHYLDQLQFLLHSRGSLQELMDDLTVCADQQYIPTLELAKLEELADHILRLINGYGRYLRQRKAAQKSELHEPPTPYSTPDEEDPFSDLPINHLTSGGVKKVKKVKWV